ncbi:MAG: glutathione S-transferase C-terminal domain-containing protein, partial [Pseudomonadota bacterium]
MTDTSVEENQTDAAKRRESGEFVRKVSHFRNEIGSAEFPAEPNRYHLFVALNCPWCHRVTLARNLLGLNESISMDIAFPSRTGNDDPIGPNLWEFAPKRIASLHGDVLKECTEETGTGQNFRLVKQIYEVEGSEETSVPILYDKLTHRIVSNESAEIVRTLNAHAERLGSTIPSASRSNFYPLRNEHDHLCGEIDRLNELIYVNINNGAYKAGFSSSQQVYNAAFTSYFDTLDELENLLASDNRPFLTGDLFTEADLRLFPTLYRHDPVYYIRMKLNGAKILDYPYLWRWLCRVYSLSGVASSTSLKHCRQGYFGRSWNNVV